MPWGLSLFPFCCKALRGHLALGQVAAGVPADGDQRLWAGQATGRKETRGCRSCISWQMPSSMCISTDVVVASYFAASAVNSLPASWPLSLPYILVSRWGFKQYLTWRYYKANTQAIKSMFYNHGLTRFFSLAFDWKKKDKKIILKALWF